MFKCLVCGKYRNLLPESICRECGTPDKVTLYCANCDKSIEVGRQALEVIRRELAAMGIDKEIPEKDGMVISVTTCNTCRADVPFLLNLFSFRNSSGRNSPN